VLEWIRLLPKIFETGKVLEATQGIMEFQSTSISTDSEIARTAGGEVNTRFCLTGNVLGTYVNLFIYRTINKSNFKSFTKVYRGRL